MSKRKNDRSTAESNNILWTCVISSGVFLALYALVDIFVESYPKWLGVIIFGVYAMSVVTCLIIYGSRRKKEKDFAEKTLLMEKAMTGMMQNVSIPCVLTLRSGLIAWSSNGAREMLGSEESLIQQNITDLCSIKLEELIEELNKPKAEETEEPEIVEDDDEEKDKKEDIHSVTIGGKCYRVTLYKQTLGKNLYFLITFEDYTELNALTIKMDKETPVVAHIALDNLNEIAEYVRVNYRSAANEIEEILKKFAEDINGFIMESGRDRYILLFSKEQYDECKKRKFDILETVRNVRLGDSSVPVTVSIGISLVGANFEEREKNAASALEFALQRGGDQVAVKTENDVLFFGGKTKGFQKKTSATARVIATRLTSIISTSPNVLIMGHANPDFDAIGACVGAARLCMFCGVKPKIIMDTENSNFKACTEKLLTLADYKNMFISAEAGLDMIKSDTLLMIVDANNFNILESSAVASNISRYVVIDHHRRVAPFETEPLLSLIEPSASSASEMITEILEQCLTENMLHKEEANLLLAGIMVDTKNFTRTTGTKTFGAAMYLRGAGANSEIARTFFHEELDSFMSEAKLTSAARMYRDNIIITESEGNNTDADRVTAAKTADKMLDIRGVEASFALVKVEGKVLISARSKGTINVQLILEKMGGGGHFDAAAAALGGVDMRSAKHHLTNAIDEYFKENP